MRVTTQVSGGNRLSEKLRDIQRRFEQVSAVKVGLPEGATSDDGLKLATIGAVQEFGSADGRIPERSFLRVPLRQKEPEIRQTFKMLMPQVVDRQITVMQMFDQIGARAAGFSQEAIAAGIAPANAPSTIAKKGSATPLIDSGNMRQSITWWVDEDA